MNQATKPSYNRIAVIFDFDDTLAPSSYHRLLESYGVDPDKFLQERVHPLIETGWDEILAKFYCLIEESQRRNDVTITDEYLASLGRNLKLFDGVPEMFDRLRNSARALIPEIEVEFYLLSSGILDIAQGIPIADQFKKMWGCQFHFNDNGEIAFIKRIITHPEKARYLLQLSKGLGEDNKPALPSDVYRNVPADELYIPLSQVIYVGDGSSDMPIFSLLNDRRGIAIGVFKSNRAANWDGMSDMHAGRRVQNLAPVDYREDSELMQSLILSIESICKQIALRQLSSGE
jgi:phosphoserine phosphatase